MTDPTPVPQVKKKAHDGILELVINRPDKKNALTRDMYRCLAESLAETDRDDTVGVVVIRGAGDCFCSGNDVKDFLTPRDPGRKSPGMLFLEVLHSMEKPLIAAVQGAAVGIGTTMLLHCDLVYASENATFQLPFVNLRLCPEGGSSFLLPRMIGHLRAFEMLVFGDPISSAMARKFGLVNSVHNEADLIDEVMRLARRLASQPRQSVLLTKRLLKQSRLSSVSQTISSEGRHFAQRLESQEFKDAAYAFLSRHRSDAG